MLRASPPLSVGQASHYYKSEFSRGDYYTERESEVPFALHLAASNILFLVRAHQALP